ncbi:MAG: DUF1501 domain-containing protein [Fuerstiella sp.]|nr:DUF1501 domain-containing protein [Fuerstiella sp.]
MLQLTGEKSRFCDGIDRRSFLNVGHLGLAGLYLPDVLSLRAACAAEQATDDRSVIFVELAGGPSQFETYDPKPNTPAEYRGEFGVVSTSTPDVLFSELMVEQAKLMDKLSIVRSVHHSSNSHDPSSHLAQTGYYKRGPKGGRSSADTMPCFGSVVAKVRGANVSGLPAYVAIPQVMRNGHASYLGKSYNPFETVADPNQPEFRIQNLAPASGLTDVRLGDRGGLLSALDRRRRMLDLQGSSTAIDRFRKQSLEMVTGPRARAAFNIKTESDTLRDKYGRHTTGQSLLMARRLVEAGVTCVTVRVTGWDDHGQLARGLKERAPAYDQGIAALVRDLYDRGIDRQVLVVAMGEFGRTPRYNQNAGRDHWGDVMSVLFAGGGLNPGIVGASNSKGELPTEAPYRPENVLAMIYRHLGIDPGLTFVDLAGRPRYVLEESGLITELI